MPESLSLTELAAIIVLHNSGDVVAECVRSVPPEVEIVLVDNASGDDGVVRAQAVRPDVAVLSSPVNRGFGGGCNLGRRATQRKVLAFVNPDVRLAADTLPILLARLAAEPHGTVGPALLEPGIGVRRCKHRPSVWLDVLGLLPSASRWAPAGWDGKLAASDPVHGRGGAVPALEGACFLVRRSDLESIGGFDEDFFLYSEEEDFARRLRAIGGAPVYEPQARAEHIGATSTAKVASFATRHRFRSRIVFYRKRDGSLRGRLAALTMALAALLSLAASVLKTMLRRETVTPPSHWSSVLVGLWQGACARLCGERVPEHATRRDCDARGWLLIFLC